MRGFDTWLIEERYFLRLQGSTVYTKLSGMNVQNLGYTISGTIFSLPILSMKEVSLV